MSQDINSSDIMNTMLHCFFALSLFVGCLAQDCATRFSDWGLFTFGNNGTLTNTSIDCGSGNGLTRIAFENPARVPDFGRIVFSCKYVGNVQFNCTDHFTNFVPIERPDFVRERLHIKQRIQCPTQQGFVERFALEFNGPMLRHYFRCCSNPAWKFQCSETNFQPTSVPTPKTTECSGRLYLNEWEFEEQTSGQFKQEHICCQLT